MTRWIGLAAEVGRERVYCVASEDIECSVCCEDGDEWSEYCRLKSGTKRREGKGKKESGRQAGALRGGESGAAGGPCQSCP